MHTSYYVQIGLDSAEMGVSQNYIQPQHDPLINGLTPQSKHGIFVSRVGNPIHLKSLNYCNTHGLTLLKENETP